MHHRILFLAVLTAAAFAAEAPQFTSDGQLLFPQDYREWVYLSSGLGMRYSSEASAEAPRFDNVFASRAAYKGFLEKGVWPENTMLVLEVRSSDSHASINQGGRFQTAISALEVEVKSGGKWAFYGFGKGAAQAKQIPATAGCYSCHRDHGAADSTFVQFYPTLVGVARDKGTLRSER